MEGMGEGFLNPCFHMSLFLGLQASVPSPSSARVSLTLWGRMEGADRLHLGVGRSQGTFVAQPHG